MIVQLQLQDNVANVIPGNVPITVTVVNPLNSLVTIDQINVSNDGSFTTSVSTSGKLMKYDGTYTIKVNYGSLDNNVTVELNGGVEVPEKTHQIIVIKKCITMMLIVVQVK